MKALIEVSDDLAGRFVKVQMGRSPTGERGRARVDSILDAAAGMILENGLAGVTMHGLAKRARTSIGSLYHFFPGVSAVFEALADRHRNATQQIDRQLGEIPASVWAELSPEDAIDRLLTPYAEYVQKHPDYIPLFHGVPSVSIRPGDHEAFASLIQTVLDARLPCTAGEQRQFYAVMLHAIALGSFQLGFRKSPSHSQDFLREIPKAVSAYLKKIEEDISAAKAAENSSHKRADI